MILGIGVMIILYSIYYLDETPTLDRFYTLLLPFMSAMLVVVLAGNVLTLFIGWELTSVISFLLVSFNGGSIEAARKGALQALIVTGGGGLALLVGLVMLGTAAGSMELNQIIANTSLQANSVVHRLYNAHLARLFYQKRTVPVSFLASGCNEYADPRECLFTLCHDGQSRYLSSTALITRPRGYPSVAKRFAHHRSTHRFNGRDFCAPSSRS